MIPKQLKDCKFCKVLYKMKKPYEKNWTNKPYTYEDITEWLKIKKENYGVLTGFGGLGVLDDDTEDKRLMKLYEENFPKTFRVRDHNYLIIKGWDGKKIKFKDNMGELQGMGQQVVGAGSIHPSGVEYDLREDIPILEVEIEKFKEVFKDYLITKENMPKKDYSPQKTDSTDFIEQLKSNISMEEVLSHFGVKTSENPTNCIFHTSKGNHCLGFNSVTAHCFNCDGSWNILSYVKQAKKYSAAEAIKWLAEFGGMVEEYEENKEEFINKSKEPMGWAKSINIKKMAERREMLECPKCQTNFKFNERLGWFKCDCSKGGIKKLIEMFK